MFGILVTVSVINHVILVSIQIMKIVNVEKDYRHYQYQNFESKLLKIDKKSYKDIDIYNIGYITIKKIGDCKNI